MNDHPKPDIRAVIAELVRTSPGERREDLSWMPMPAGLGFLPLTVKPGKRLDQWTIGDSAFTVKEFHTARRVLIAEGLGFTAEVTWSRPTFSGSAVAWGATAQAAAANLAVDLRGLWPWALAAAVEPARSSAWKPGERRTTADCVTVIAPKSADAGAALEARRANLRLRVDLSSRPDWGRGLMEALEEISPLPLAMDLAAAHATSNYPDRYESPSTRTNGRGTVMPVTPRPHAG